MTVSNETGGELYGLDEESREMVIETVRQLQKRLLTRERILEFDKKDIFPEEEIRGMLGDEIGLQLLFIPEEYGGMGGGARDCCAVTKEMSRICLGVATGFFAIQLGSDPIIVGGTEEQKEKWLGRIAEGDTLVAYGVTEPGAGSNVASLTTKADPVTGDNGEITGYVLNGTKQFISTGGYADIVTILAKTPEGPTFFIVEKGAKGFSAGKGEEKHGIRASNTSPLTLDDVFVPVENLVGGVPGNGLKQANEVFGYTRLMVGAMSLGAAESAMEIAIKYARERIQFGSPLSEKQGYTHKLIVPDDVRLEAARAYIDETARRIDSGELDLQVEGSIAKLFTTESANMAAEHAIQALGGYGYICEFEVEKIKRDVRITCIYEGASEILQSIISTFRWKKTWKSKGGFYNGIAEEMDALNATAADCGGAVMARAARVLNDAIMLANDLRLTRQQTVMFALADLMAVVEVGAAMCRKAAAGDEVMRARARIFSGLAAEKFAALLPYIVYGTGAMDAEKAAAFMEKADMAGFAAARAGMITDMDLVADRLFERK